MAIPTPTTPLPEPEVRAFPASISEAVKRLEMLPLSVPVAIVADGTIDSEKTVRLSLAARLKNGKWSFGGYLERRKTGKFAAGGTIIWTP